LNLSEKNILLLIPCSFAKLFTGSSELGRETTEWANKEMVLLENKELKND
jgi:hypothetical protein